MRRVQAVPGRDALAGAARGYSRFGEHAAGWLVLAALAAALDRPRRRDWVVVGGAAFTAHAAAVVLKRVVRRRRPADPVLEVLVRTPSDLSFPSAHAASTTAAAVALVPVVGAPVAGALAGAMMLSRVLLGVHYPTDVLAGAALGAVSATVVRRGADAVAGRTRP
ncbi:phosphatase PAP2 family protein [Cellulomonas sp. Marseille-Q8402]